jgi:hypothetical protein
MLMAVIGYGSSHDTSGTYGTIAVIFLFQGFYAFAITPMTSLYATEIAPYKLRTTAIAIFRAFDSGFGYVHLSLPHSDHIHTYLQQDSAPLTLNFFLLVSSHPS